MKPSHILFQLQGRIGRNLFWKFCPLVIISGLIIYSIVEAIFGSGAAFFFAFIPAAWMCIAIQTKRWHDRNRSGWWILITLIPYVGIIWWIIECGILPGTTGSNKFGSNPRINLLSGHRLAEPIQLPTDWAHPDESVTVLSVTKPQKCPICKGTRITEHSRSGWRCIECEHWWA